jgi:hypothetical protein
MHGQKGRFKMKNSYNEGGPELGSLSSWQLINEIYSTILTESASLSNLVLVEPASTEERLKLDSLVLSINNKLSSIIRYLGTLLDSSSGAKTIGELYGWYLDNLDIVCSSGSSCQSKKVAGNNLVEQSKGFLDIWQGMKHAV